MPLQRLIGTQAFLPALIARIRDHLSSSAVPLDNVIFQSILLCLIAGDKHLILRTPEEDIALTVKLVVWQMHPVTYDVVDCIALCRCWTAETLAKWCLKHRLWGVSQPYLQLFFYDFPPQYFQLPFQFKNDRRVDLIRHFLGINVVIIPIIIAVVLNLETRTLKIHPACSATYVPSAQSTRAENSQSQIAESVFLLLQRLLKKNRDMGTATLSSIFDLPTRKLKIRPRNATSRPSANALDPVALFLRSLFLQAPSSESNSNYTSPNEDDEGSTTEAKSSRKQRPRVPKHSASNASIKSPRPIPAPTDLASIRSRTYPNITTPPIIRTTSPESILMQGSIFDGTNPGILKPTPMYPANYPAMAHAFTDPLPVRPAVRRSRKRHGGSRSSGLSKQLLQLPKALVVSGLEGGSEAVQRALAQVIREKKVTLSGDDENEWPLPEDFIVVYVCPWNSRERPEIHKTLLDKFAMSTNVFVSQSVRRDFNLMSLWPSGPPRPFHTNDLSSQSNPSSPSAGYPLPLSPNQTYTPPVSNKPLPAHRQHPSSSSAVSGPSIPPKPQNPPFPSSLLKALREAYSRVHFSSNLLLYLSDVFTAARHNPRLDGTLLTATAMKDAHALIKASRVIGSDLTGAELLRPPAVDSDLASSTTGESSRYFNDVEDGEDQMFQDARSTFDLGEERQGLLTLDEVAQTTSGHGHDHHAHSSLGKRVADVSEVDVARIVPRVVSHRLRVRDGPEEEVLASALFGATFRPPAELLRAADADADGHGDESKPLSVKNLLVQILAEV